MRRIALLAASSLGTLAALPASATVVLALDLRELTWRSDRVVVADVVAMRPAWDGRRERIDTWVELRVVESWKGEVPAGGRVVVRRAGGTVNGITMVVIGEAGFVAGERAVVFLKGPSDRAQVVGMAQGKRTLRRDAAGRSVAEGTAGGARAVAPDAGGKLVPAPAPPSVPLDDLRAEVRSLAERKR